MGRPSKYREDHHPLVAHWMARCGLTDEQMAEGLGIGTATFYRWLQRHDEFRESIKDGKDIPDDQVETELLRRALGYDTEETRTYGAVDQSGTAHIERIVNVKKHVAADITAAIFWLCNRRRDKWRRNPDMVLSAEEGVPIVIHRQPKKEKVDA